MTELSDAHPTLSDEKSSFTLSDAQPELCVVTLSHCDSLSTCARLLLANQHWRGISAQDSTWRALCKVVARDALLVFEPDQLLSTHGSYRAAARWLHGLRHTFKRPVDGEAAAHVEPKFSIKVGVRFRPHGTAAEQPAEAASAEQLVSSDRVVLPLHQRLQLLQQAHDCSASEARRRLWASAANSDPWASAACADKENNAVAERKFWNGVYEHLMVPSWPWCRLKLHVIPDAALRIGTDNQAVVHLPPEGGTKPLQVWVSFADFLKIANES